MAKVLLINPKGSELVNHGNSQIPLGYLYLAAECKLGGHDVRFVDGCISTHQEVRDSFKWNPDIIGVQCLTIKRKEAFDLMRLARKMCPGAKIVTGGPHTGSCKKQVLEHYQGIVDGVCVGEGERWLRSYADTGNAPMQDNWYKNLDELPMPAYELVDFRQYLSHFNSPLGLKAWVQYGRSCSFSCSFCSVWSIWKEFRIRSPEHMMEELRYLYYHRNIRHFNFVDDIMTQQRDPVIELCEAIIRDGMKIKMHFLTRVDCVDKELLNLLARAGCYDIDYGVESGSLKILKGIHKDNFKSDADVERYKDHCRNAIKWTREAGIQATSLLMVGNRGEMTETVMATRRAVQEYKPSSIHPFVGIYILPQTALFQQAKRDGHIEDDCWLDENKTYYYPHPKWKMLLWHFLVASVRWDTLKRRIMNFVMQRQRTGDLRRWLFLQLRKRFL